MEEGLQEVLTKNRDGVEAIVWQIMEEEFGHTEEYSSLTTAVVQVVDWSGLRLAWCTVS